MVKIIAAAALVGVVAARDHWAVIVAGSNGYSNYRHQADACHAYQIMRNKGIAEDHIIMMAYDDIANHPLNPVPGKLFNKPTAAGVEGNDVYAGCNIDYKGADVTPDNFMKVLTGTASGKSLQSTSEDNVFINFVDHGSPGLISFPGYGPDLHKKQLQDTLQTMSDKNMFHKLSFYLETCYSGSMFQDMSIPNVYALSAANPTQSSYGAYCYSDKDGLPATRFERGSTSGGSVNGKNIGSCLGDLFSVNWMEDSEADVGLESLGDAFKVIRAQTTKSVVMQWGDTSFTDDKSAEFIGTENVNSNFVATPEVPKSPVNVRQVDLDRLYNMYAAATTSAERLQIGEELQQELASQMKVDLIHNRFLALMYPDNEDKQAEMREGKEKPANFECEMRVHEAIVHYAKDYFYAKSGFALQFHQIVVNLCAEWAMANGPISHLESAVKAACNLDGSSGVVV